MTGPAERHEPPETHEETRYHRPRAWTWSVWPFIAGLGMPVIAWGVVAVPLLVLLGVALLLVGAIGGIRENLVHEEVDQDAGAVPHLVLSGGLILVTALFHAAGLRVLAAHGLLGPESWPADVPLVTFGSVSATVLLVLAGLAVWAAWVLGARTQLFSAFVVFFMVGHYVALGLHMQGLAAEGFVISQGPAGSAYYWVVGLHVVFSLGATVALFVTAWNAGTRPGGRGPFAGAALFFAWTVVAWLLLFVIVHLHWVGLDFRLL